MPKVSPGDFGRRVAWHREELELSLAELAERSGMTESYLTYLEKRPDTPTPQTVVRLARALKTTPDDLLGGLALLPPGRGRAAPEARLIPLDRSECLQLLAPGGIGRIAYTTVDGPMILPVNFGLAPDNIVFRTAVDSPLAGQAGHLVAFEGDGIDEAKSEGWSVVVIGALRKVTDEAEVYLLTDWLD